MKKAIKVYSFLDNLMTVYPYNLEFTWSSGSGADHAVQAAGTIALGIQYPTYNIPEIEISVGTIYTNVPWILGMEVQI